MDEINKKTEEITTEVLNYLEKMMWDMAWHTKIPGYDQDDLMQEMRIKVWESIRDDKFDPTMAKRSVDGITRSYFFMVCKNHLLRLTERSKAKLRADWDSPDTNDLDNPTTPDSIQLELYNNCTNDEELKDLYDLLF